MNRERIVMVEQLELDERPVVVREAVPTFQPANDVITYRAVFCAECQRLSLVLVPGLVCATCLDEREETERWARLRRLTSGRAA